MVDYDFTFFNFSVLLLEHKQHLHIQYIPKVQCKVKYFLLKKSLLRTTKKAGRDYNKLLPGFVTSLTPMLHKPCPREHETTHNGKGVWRFRTTCTSRLANHIILGQLTKLSPIAYFWERGFMEPGIQQTVLTRIKVKYVKIMLFFISSLNTLHTAHHAHNQAFKKSWSATPLNVACDYTSFTSCPYQIFCIYYWTNRTVWINDKEECLWFLEVLIHCKKWCWLNLKKLRKPVLRQRISSIFLS